MSFLTKNNFKKDFRPAGHISSSVTKQTYDCIVSVVETYLYSVK